MQAHPQPILKHWNPGAHALFIEGKVQKAIDLIFEDLKTGAHFERFNQVAYYYSFVSYADALTFYKIYLDFSPRNIEAIYNVTVCCLYLRRYSEAINYAQQILALLPDYAPAFEALAHAFGELGDTAEARKAGTRALLLKDREATRQAYSLKLPTEEDMQKILLFTDAKKKVCAFSLFGSNPRYLRGALYNVIAGKELYPEWIMRFYVDDTVPRELKDALRSLDAEVLEQEAGHPRDRKLCWRFLVASDPEVGRFMVRDCDSAFSLREALVVDEWLESGKLFHVIRDWYTHTDLMLAGLWGGVSGVLPNMQNMLDDFFATNKVATSSIDQIFLAQYVWSTIKESCLIHDRLFDSFSPRRPPMKHFRTRDDHIGANRFANDRKWQNKCLAPWIRELPCLAVQMTKKG